jgi:hypothetical protein
LRRREDVYYSQLLEESMHAKRTAGACLALLVSTSLFVLAGCGDTMITADPSAVDDEETLRGYLEDDSIFDDMGPYEVGQIAAGGSDDREEIDPLTFWRVVTDHDCYREIVHDPGQGTAEVTVHRQIWGDLHIIDESMVEHVKPFHHTGIRYATFVRDPAAEPTGGAGHGQGGQGQGTTNEHHYRRGPWILTELSGFLAESDTLTVGIDWIRVQSASVDVTISDPLELMTVPDEIMVFEVGEDVTVTVSGPPEGAILFLHTRRWKSPFQYDGVGAFVGTWTVTRRGRHCAWVEAMAHDTLFDSEHPEDTLIWGMPYAVFDEEIEE